MSTFKSNPEHFKVSMLLQSYTKITVSFVLRTKTSVVLLIVAYSAVRAEHTVGAIDSSSQ
jgi:hypothetical protein